MDTGQGKEERELEDAQLAQGPVLASGRHARPLIIPSAMALPRALGTANSKAQARNAAKD